MNENHIDAPGTAQEPVVHPTKPLWWFVYAHCSLVVLVTPPFLFSVFRVLFVRGGPMVPAPGLLEVLFVVGYVALLFRKERAYMILVIASLIVEAILIYPVLSYSTRWLTTEDVIYVIWFGLILVTASICGLNCGRQKNGRVTNEKVDL